MPTFYIGYRPVLKGRSDPVNTYTGKAGVYSNWDLMNPSHVLDGAPDYNVQPGTGAFPHALQLSRWFLGLDRSGKELANAGILYPDVYSGRYNTWLYNGTPAALVWAKHNRGFVGDQGAGGFGHPYNWGGTAGVLSGNANKAGLGFSADYASLGDFYYGLSTTSSGAFKSSRPLGHVERYPTYKTATEASDQPFSFGAFEPYIYKGVVTERSDPLSSQIGALGHTYYDASGVGVLGTDRYGDEHTLEWHGVPSAKAL